MVAGRVKKTKIAADGGSDHIDCDSIANLSMGKLEELQDQLNKVNVEVCVKVLEIEQKYNDIKRPVYARRGEIIKSIPDFWLTFLSHPVLSDLLMEEDRKSAASGVTPEKKGNKRPPTDESDTEQMDIAEVIQDEEADEEDSEGDEDNDEVNVDETNNALLNVLQQ